MSLEKRRRYSLRLLSPFRGTLQVIEAGEGRAASGDGRFWQVHLRCEVVRRGWGSLEPAQLHSAWAMYGIWSPRQGLRRLPLDPKVDLEQVRGKAETFLPQLAELQTELPFPPGDPCEAWLLDSGSRPLVLLGSVRHPARRPAVEPHWLPASPPRIDFESPSLARAGIARGEAGNHHLERLGRLVTEAAGAHPRVAWFERAADGRGRALDGAEPAWMDRAQFPPLLLREDWPDAADRALVGDYLDWQAPRLLTLAGLARETRARLERVACERPVETYEFHRLYPEILDSDRMNAALVEARLRLSNEAGTE